MDGYALIAEDVKDASPDNPVRLKMADSIAAGYESDRTLRMRSLMISSNGLAQIKLRQLPFSEL